MLSPGSPPLSALESIEHMPAPESPLTPSDVIRLFGAFNRELKRIVRASTAARWPVIEDACQVAWTALICPGQGVAQGPARAWLVRTAVREALRLTWLEAREASLDRAQQAEVDRRRCATEAELPELVSWREQMHSVGRLSARQQRLVWLRAIGFGYEEIARYESVSYRTVRRQLERAHRQLRALGAPGQIDRAAA